MGFFKNLFGLSDDKRNDDFYESLDYSEDSDDEEDIYDDGDGSSTSSDTSYSIAKVRIVGFENLEDADKDYIRNRLKEDDHVYLRYNFECPDKKKALQVYKHSWLLGYIDPKKAEILHKYLRESKIGAVVVSKIKSKDFKISTELDVYYEDPNGEEPLPYYPLEGRQLDVVEVDLWTGQEYWSGDWFLNIFTDELCYKYINMYDETVDEEEIKDVDWQFYFWVNSYLDGTCITRKGADLYLDRLKTDSAKKVLVKRMESYLENKGFNFADKELFSDDEAIGNSDTSSVVSAAKLYAPTYEISYIDGQGKRQNRTIKNANMNSFIAGIKYRENYEEMLSKLSEGMEVELKKDPDNPYDSNAIAVYNGDDHLGYIPKRDIPVIVLNMEVDSMNAKIEYVDNENVDLIVPVTFERILMMSDDDLVSFRFYKTERTKYVTGYIESNNPINKEEFVEGIRLQRENN